MITLTSIHPPTRTLALVTGTVLAVAAGLVVHPAVAISLGFGAAAATVDAQRGVLPDGLVIGAALPPALLALAATFGAAAPSPPSVLAGALVLAGPLFVIHMASPTALGFGDVKLGAALGASLGLVDPRLGLAALCVATGGSLLWAVASRRASIAFGPGLVVGTAAAAAVAALTGGGPA